MLDRSYREKYKTGERQRGGVWRHARMFLVAAIVAAMVSGNLLVEVKAAAGDLDMTFSTDGKQRTTFGLKTEAAYALALQSDGKIVVAGFTYKDSTLFDFALARYNTDGTLDTTFSDDGKQTTDLARNDIAHALAIQSDGKIVVAGQVAIGEGIADFALVRYNSDGSLDTTFSDDGKVITEFGVESAALGIAIQPNGKIVLGGFTQNPDNFAVARYNTNGSLDTTFSSDGKQTTNFSSGSLDYARDIAIQPNGKIVLAGTSSNNGGTYGFAVVRYNTNGTLDTTFSGDGKLRTFIGSNAVAQGVAIQSNNRIVVAGSSYGVSGDTDFTLARYNGNGSLDDGTVNDQTPSDMFGTNGIVTTDFFANYDQADDLAIQTDGKIVAAGYAAHRNLTTNPDFALARYNIDGTLDMTFNGDGKQTTDLYGTNRDEARALAIQNDGKIVLAGYLGKTNGNFDIVLARYLGD